MVSKGIHCQESNIINCAVRNKSFHYVFFTVHLRCRIAACLLHFSLSFSAALRLLSSLLFFGRWKQQRRSPAYEFASAPILVDENPYGLLGQWLFVTAGCQRSLHHGPEQRSEENCSWGTNVSSGRTLPWCTYCKASFPPLQFHPAKLTGCRVNQLSRGHGTGCNVRALQQPGHSCWVPSHTVQVSPSAESCKNQSDLITRSTTDHSA